MSAQSPTTQAANQGRTGEPLAAAATTPAETIPSRSASPRMPTRPPGTWAAPPIHRRVVERGAAARASANATRPTPKPIASFLVVDTRGSYPVAPAPRADSKPASAASTSSPIASRS